MADPTLRSIVWWMLGSALALYALAGLWRLFPALSGRWRRAGPVSLAAFCVAMASLVLVMEPVHSTGATADGALSAWHTRLPVIAALAGIAGVLSGLLGAAHPLGWGVRLGWPTALYAAFALVAYRWIANMIPASDHASTEGLQGQARPYLVLLVAFPLAAFAAGALGAAFGSLLRRVAR